MNIFLDLLKANKILKDPSTPDRIAQQLLGPQVVSPVPPTPQEQAVNTAKNLLAHMAGQFATDIPNAAIGAVNISPPVELYKRLTQRQNFNNSKELGYAMDALAPIGYLAFPAKSALGGGGNVALQGALNLINGRPAQKDYAQNFASGMHNTGAILAALGALGSGAAVDSKKYAGDMLKDKYPQTTLETGQKLVRDLRFKSPWK